MNKASANNRIPITLLCAFIVAGALVVRVMHDRNASHVATFADIERIARSNPADVEAQMAWGAALNDAHRFDDASAVYTSVANHDPDDVRPIEALARIAMERYRTQDAIHYMAESLRINPNNAENQSCLGTLLFKQNPTAALQAFERASALDPNNAFSWLKLGQLEMNRRNAARGIHDLQRAAVLNPNDMETEIELGNSAQICFRPTVAKAAFEKALTLHPDDPTALLGAANAALELDPSRDGLARAGAQLEKVMAVKPTGDVYLARGHWILLMRRYQSADTDLKKALSLDPSLGGAHAFLSQSYSALGEGQLAKQESAAYMAIPRVGGPQDPPVVAHQSRQ